MAHLQAERGAEKQALLARLDSQQKQADDCITELQVQLHLKSQQHMKVEEEKQALRVDLTNQQQQADSRACQLELQVQQLSEQCTHRSHQLQQLQVCFITYSTHQSPCVALDNDPTLTSPCP